MMERLLARMDAIQKRLEAKTKANYENMADLKTQIGSLTSRIDVNQENEEAFQREISQSREDGGSTTLFPVRLLEETIGWNTFWRMSTKRRRASARNLRED
jgi:hypothetical protein